MCNWVVTNPIFVSVYWRCTFPSWNPFSFCSAVTVFLKNESNNWCDCPSFSNGTLCARCHLLTNMWLRQRLTASACFWGEGKNLKVFQTCPQVKLIKWEPFGLSRPNVKPWAQRLLQTQSTAHGTIKAFFDFAKNVSSPINFRLYWGTQALCLTSRLQISESTENKSSATSPQLCK